MVGREGERLKPFKSTVSSKGSERLGLQTSVHAFSTVISLTGNAIQVASDEYIKKQGAAIYLDCAV